MLFKVDGVEKLLEERSPAYHEYSELIRELKKFIKPYDSYQDLKRAADPLRQVKVTLSMQEVDQASGLLFFTTTSEVLNREHVFYQGTHAFLWESFNRGRVANFASNYKTLTRFQERMQFKFGKSCSYLMRGRDGAGKGKEEPSSMQEFFENRNFAFMHPNTISKRNPAPTFESTTFKEEILTAIDLLVNFNVQPVEPQKTDLQVFLVNKSTDGMLLKPGLRYAPQLHRVVGLEDPYFLTFQQVKDLCSRSEEDILKYLKSLDFASEAQEFRIASLDGLVSFPVGCFFRSSKGGSARIKGYDQDTQESLQVCKNCLLSGSNCAVSCNACEDQIVVCEVCVALGYDSTESMRRKCKPCQLKGLACTRMLEMSWVSDSEAAQRAHMTQLEREQDQKVPIPDPPHVLKLVRSALFNYWTFVGNYLVSLKLLSCTRGDSNKAISKPIASVLPRSCLRNKDQMDMNTAVTIFRK